MVKVGILTSSRMPFDRRALRKQGRSLAEAGYDVTYIVPHDRDEVVDGVKIKAVDKPRGKFQRMTRTVWQVYREAISLNAQIYHFHDAEMIFIGLLLAMQGKKVIYDIHDDAAQSLLTRHYIPVWLRRPLAWLVEQIENRACRFFSGLTPAVPGLAERYKGTNQKVVVIQNFPRQEDLMRSAEVSWDRRACVVAYVGMLEEERKIRELIEAMGLLPDNLPVMLKLGGRFAPPSLREEMVRMGGWKRVEELGFLDQDGMAKVYQVAKVGIALVSNEPKLHYCYPTKMFDYMSANMPVIATDIPLFRKIVENAGCGLLVDSNEPQNIAHAIEYLLTHSEEAEAMGRRGRAAVEKMYNWGTEEKKLLRFFADLAKPVSS